MSTDMAVAVSKKFLREMAQPFDLMDKVGVAVWSAQDVKRHTEEHQRQQERLPIITEDAMEE